MNRKSSGPERPLVALGARVQGREKGTERKATAHIGGENEWKTKEKTRKAT